MKHLTNVKGNHALVLRLGSWICTSGGAA